jgi:D-3-phosphoglycerate dehydrogenase
MKVIGYDPYIAHPYLAKENGISLTGLKEVLGCDYISIHADLNGTSQHMINDSAFQQMKPSAYLINTSRGKIIDESALIKALLEKRIAGAGLDVFEIEPLPQNSPLTTMDNVIMLPHSASYSDHSFDIAPVNIAQEAARILHGQWPKNVVNQSVIPKIQLVKAI